MRKILPLLLSIFLMIYSCGITIPLSKSKDELSKLELLMTKDEIKQKIGEPDEIRGSITNIDGDKVSVWQYNLHNKSVAARNFVLGIFTLTLFWWVPPRGSEYWLYFVENKLAQWGRAGDWQPDLIMKIRLEEN